ncbi:MAG: tRNA lysidine(34) synthetase TilS [Halobacteriovoraceae bacterium]|nr:tRNA lysidine(34) synthetase TilS [Halobacteriovoraceae bacterium]|tara:strand:- start:10017 stop:11300 length:1284 start_codon:yes stop_codon:yes gene_type:complete
MNKTKLQDPYSYRFLNHLKNFIEEYSLFEKTDDLLLAVSGGLDSMVLLKAISELNNYGYSNKIRVITINHGTRKSQKDEVRLVKNYAFKLGFKTIVKNIEKSLSEENFEAQARIERYRIFHKVLWPGEKLLLAHHIDDSFEWTLLQQLRSSSLKGSLGIPLKNKNIVRPFLCLTRSQIETYGKLNLIDFVEDPTNKENRFERNFLRNEVIPQFQNRHVKYLKHYVFRQNELARVLGVHLLDRKKSSLKIINSDHSLLGYSYKNDEDFSGIESILSKGLKKINPKSRGVTAEQFKRIKAALKNHKRGPLTLSGGVSVFLDYNMFLMTTKKAPKLNEVELGNIKLEEFETVLDRYMSDSSFVLSFPFFVQVQSPGLDTRQFNTSFNIEAVKTLKKSSNSYYPALRLLREWSKKRNRFKSLSIKLMLVKY